MKSRLLNVRQKSTKREKFLFSKKSFYPSRKSRHRGPLKIFVSQKAGACGGVQQAVIRAEMEKAPVLGQVVHNERLVARLEERGIPMLDRNESIESLRARGISRVTITAHGDPIKRFEELKAAGIEIIDTTCPIIEKGVYQNIARYEGEGYQVILIGNPQHPEVIGAVSRGKTVKVIYNETDIDHLSLDPNKPILVLCQTTITETMFLEISGLVRKKFDNVICLDTRCKPVAQTQQGILDLAPLVDLMLIMGGQKSSNTAKLAQLAERFTRTIQINGPDNIQYDWFEDVDRLGIGAGTSTATTDIDLLIDHLDQMIPLKLWRDVEVDPYKDRLPRPSDRFLGIVGERPK